MTTSSTNYTGLYGGGAGGAIPNTAYGNANVVSLLAVGTDGGNTVGNISATGNITTGGILTDNYYYANGAPFSGGGGGGGYGNSNVATYLASGTLASNVITTANISGQYILGNGSQLTGLPATYGNSNVATFLANFGSNSISTTGNVTAGYFAGNGSLLTNINAGNIVGSYGNANVVSLMANFGSNTIVTTGNIDTGNLNATNLYSTGVVSAAGNVRGGNVNTVGNVSATGNAIAAYFVGNGSALSSITGANVSGTVANATYAVSAGSATTAGTVTTAAQPNITSVGTLTSVTSTGNVAGGNLTTGGQVSATGNITGSYYFGNGSQLTGIVATLPSTISVTGNITGGNIISNGIISSAGNASVGGNLDVGQNIQVSGGINAFGSLLNIGNIAAGNIVTSGSTGNVTVGGNLTVLGPTYGGTANFTGTVGANILLVNNAISAGTTVSAAGNIITAGNFVGNGAALTGITTSVGGSNTYIQYNNNGTLGGAAGLNYNYATNYFTGGLLQAGDPTGSNAILVINSAVPWSQASSPNPGRITIGPGFGGLYTNTYDPLSVVRGSQLSVFGKYTVGNTDTNQSLRGLSSLAYVDTGGTTLSNTNRRLTAGAFSMNYGNGTYTVPSGGGMSTFAGSITAATVGNVGGVVTGNATVSHLAGHFGSINIQASGTVGNALGFISNPGVGNSQGIITNQIAYAVSQGGTTGQVVPTTVIGLYNPNTTATYGFTNSNAVRSAANYYFLKNDDAVARNAMGSMETYTEYAYQSGTSGSIDVNKNNGQVQQWNLTGNATLTVSNFVTSASDGVNTDYQADTVTLIINQGSTGGYGVTFPTPSSIYKYAGNITSLQSTAANSVTMVSITGVFMNGASTYLFTISPGFV